VIHLCRGDGSANKKKRKREREGCMMNYYMMEGSIVHANPGQIHNP
jgi:hypothetical protein